MRSSTLGLGGDGVRAISDSRSRQDSARPRYKRAPQPLERVWEAAEVVGCHPASPLRKMQINAISRVQVANDAGLSERQPDEMSW